MATHLLSCTSYRGNMLQFPAVISPSRQSCSGRRLHSPCFSPLRIKRSLLDLTWNLDPGLRAHDSSTHGAACTARTTSPRFTQSRSPLVTSNEVSVCTEFRFRLPPALCMPAFVMRVTRPWRLCSSTNDLLHRMARAVHCVVDSV